MPAGNEQGEILVVPPRAVGQREADLDELPVLAEQRFGASAVAGKHGCDHVVVLPVRVLEVTAAVGGRHPVEADGGGVTVGPMEKPEDVRGRNVRPAHRTQARMVNMLGGGSVGTSAEVSALTCFLLSDRASFITGSYHLVDGGYTAQ